MITYAGEWLPYEYIGVWSQDDLEQAEQAIADVNIALIELCGLGAMDKLFGDITLEACQSVSGEYYGYVSKHKPRHIQLEIGHIDALITPHELGHVLILTDPNDPNIADRLGSTVIRTASGRAVTGMGRGGYSRHMGYRATKYTGYHSINYPAHQHPYNVDDGNTPTEDWCDMFLSWVTGNIADNEAGQALKNFVESYLIERLACS